MSARWDLIHLLARVDGNDRSGAAADTNILDHLYGKQADAIISDGWSKPRELSRTRLEAAATDRRAP